MSLAFCLCVLNALEQVLGNMLGKIDIAVIEKLHVMFGSCPAGVLPSGAKSFAHDADREELWRLIFEMRQISICAESRYGDAHFLHLQLSHLDAALEFRVRSAASLRHSTRLFAAAEQLTAEDEEQDPDYTVDDESDSEAEEEVRICAPCTQFGGLELKEYTDLEHFLDEQLGEEICWPKWPPTLDSTQPPQLQGIHSCLDELEYSVEPCADPLCCHSPNACTVVSLSNLEPFIDRRTFPQTSHGECRFRQALQRRPASFVTLSTTHRRDVRCRRAVARQAAERSVRSCERWLVRMWDAAQTVATLKVEPPCEDWDGILTFSNSRDTFHLQLQSHMSGRVRISIATLVDRAMLLNGLSYHPEDEDDDNDDDDDDNYE